MFVVSKMTGLEKPAAAEFEEFPLDGESTAGTNVSQQLPDYLEDWSTSSAPPSSTSNTTGGKVREGRTFRDTDLLVCLFFCSFYFATWNAFCLWSHQCLTTSLRAVEVAPETRMPRPHAQLSFCVVPHYISVLLFHSVLGAVRSLPQHNEQTATSLRRRRKSPAAARKRRRRRVEANATAMMAESPANRVPAELLPSWTCSPLPPPRMARVGLVRKQQRGKKKPRPENAPYLLTCALFNHYNCLGKSGKRKQEN